MRLFSGVISATLVVVLVSLSIASSASGDTIYANRRPESGGAPFESGLIMNAYDLSTGSDVTPAQFASTYDSSYVVDGLAYYDGYLYSAGGLASDSSGGGKVQVFDAATGAVSSTITVDSSDIVRGLVCDFSGNLYCHLGGGGVSKVLSDGTTVISYWGTDAYSGGADLEIFGDDLYAGTSSGVYSFDLANGGAATQLSGTSGYQVTGLTFTDDGTLYTVCNNTSRSYGKDLLEWAYNDTTDEYEITAEINISDSAKDVDLIDGFLYISSNSYTRAIMKYDYVNDDLTVWQTADSAYAKAGYLVNTPLTIPEPSVVVLLATGLFGLLAYAWRKRK